MAKEKGFFIRNLTETIQVCKVDKEFQIILQPRGMQSDMVYVPYQYTDHMLIRKMLNNKSVEEVEDKTATKLEEKASQARERAIAEQEKAVLENIDIAPQNDYVEVQCCAPTQKGTRCERKFTLKVKDRDQKGGLVFCPTHAKENPEDYAKVDGEWSKR